MFDLHISSRTDRISAIGATQIELEELYAKHQRNNSIRADFAKDLAEAIETQTDVPVDFALDLMTQMSLHLQASVSTLVGILQHHFKDEEKPAQACALALLQACKDDIVDYDDVTEMIVVRYEMSPSVREQVERFQYPLPMIEKPQEVRHNRQTGYRTIPGSLILKQNHHDDDVCLDHINRMNAQKLSVNPQVVAFIQNKWKHLDKRKDGETVQDFQKRKKAFAKFDRTSRDVIDAMLLAGNEFWLTHKYDKRGRTYCQGYHIQPQGNEWQKAVVEFADAEPLNEE